MQPGTPEVPPRARFKFLPLRRKLRYFETVFVTYKVAELFLSFENFHELACSMRRVQVVTKVEVSSSEEECTVLSMRPLWRLMKIGRRDGIAAVITLRFMMILV